MSWWIDKQFGRTIGSKFVIHSRRIFYCVFSQTGSWGQSCSETHSCRQPGYQAVSHLASHSALFAGRQWYPHSITRSASQVASQPFRPAFRRLGLGQLMCRLYVRRTFWHFKLIAISKVVSVLHLRSGYFPASGCVTAVLYCFSNRSWCSFDYLFPLE